MRAGKNLNTKRLAEKITKCRSKRPSGASNSPHCHGRIS